MKSETIQLEKDHGPKCDYYKIIESEVSKITENATKVEYQNIEYSMLTTGKLVSYYDHVEIDFQKAVSETMSLDWTLFQNGISFINNKLDECLVYTRAESNFWYAQTSPKINGKRVGYFVIACADTDNIMATLRLFFEESAWMNTLQWKQSSGLFDEKARTHHKGACKFGSIYI